ncbi:type I-E CRISPR-associated protein Cas6/Cse3/CasE [Kytococcus schroeteri]|uniref:type I-E CRISPR-associated protein Cas6/Cse3/CasE n=1 Tax=Kytococcus schroeteri TaxID=138300 RepID=UPI0035EB9921
MTVLTRMAVNPATRSGRKIVFNRQAMHAAVMAAFSPERHEEMEGRPLWRLDHDGHRHVLYVVSPVEPDLTHVVEQAGWAGESWSSTDYGPFLARLRTGQSWGFRLTANPVKNVAQAGARSKILPYVTPAQQLWWLARRAEGWGFGLPLEGGELYVPGEEPSATDSEPPSVMVSNSQDERFGRKDAGRGGAKVTLRMAQFDGILQVTDAQRLREALVSGMGRAKAYGCGLMTLRPAVEGSA